MAVSGFLGRLREGLSRTTREVARHLESLTATAPAAGSAVVGDDTLEALEEVLIAADVGVRATERVIDAVKRDAPRGIGLRESVKAEIRALFAAVPRSSPSAMSGKGGPRVVLVVGVNGTGKTTTVGKLARVLQRGGSRVLVCAADTYRAAAVQQLDVWAARAGVPIVRAQDGADPASVVFDALKAAQARGMDVVLVDTAGRLHTRVNLMKELEKIRRVAARAVEGAPHEVLLVLDATVGQNGLVQARQFMEAAGVDGIVLSKLDGTARGGIAVAIAHELGLPIRYVGVGEGLDDLVPFSADDYVDALFEQGW